MRPTDVKKRCGSITGTIGLLFFIEQFLLNTHFVYVHDAKIAKENGETLRFCSNYCKKCTELTPCSFFNSSLPP